MAFGKKLKEMISEEENSEDSYYTTETVSMPSGTGKMILLEPRAFSESQQIADHLKKRNTVVVNMKRVTPEHAKRIIDFLSGNKILTPIISSLIGLIPNCASSVIITRLYASDILSLGSCLAGLLSGSGVGLLILYKQNKNIKENIMITLLLILIASICGIAINLI